MWTLDNPLVTLDNPLFTLDGGLILTPPLIVTAVSAGEYQGLYYVPGDVFLLAQQSDYSDSTQNYQAFGNEWAPGWMLYVPLSTPLFRAADVAPYPTYPAVDAARRFVL